MPNLPGVKLDSNGMPAVVGVTERTLTQTQADYTDLQKSFASIGGIDAYNTRRMFSENPEASAGLITSLAKTGVLPTNPIITTLAQIDKMTQDQRKADAITASNKISTERFKGTLQGKAWSTFKFATTLVGALGNTVVEALTSPGRVALEDWNKIKDQPSEAFKFKPGPKISLETPSKIVKQLTVYQIAKEAITTGKLELGDGFSINEEIGAGFAARQEQLKYNKVSFKQNGKTYYRPWSLFDPAASVLTNTISPDGSAARVVTALGDIGLMVATDPFLAYSRVAKAAADAKKIAEAGKGIAAAKAAKELSILESQLAVAKKRTKDALDAMHGSKTAISKDKWTTKYIESFQQQTKIQDEYKNLNVDYDAIIKFVSGASGEHIIDAIANTDDWLKIQKMAKGGFKADEALALSKATTREQVLKVLAPLIQGGDVVQRELESGTRVGRALSGVTASAKESVAVRALSDAIETVLPKADRIKITGALRGVSGASFNKLPYHENILEISNSIHSWGGKVKEEVVLFGRKYGALLPQSGGTLIHLDDKDAILMAVNNVARYMKLDKATTDILLTEIATAPSKGEAGIKATGKLFDTIFEKYKGRFTGEQLIEWQKATRAFDTERRNMSTYWAQQHAKGADITFGVIGGEKVNIHGPHLDSELLNSFVFIPDPKAMKDFIDTSIKFATLGKGIHLAKEGISNVNSIWKKTVLVRPAYIVRNIIEEQIRVFGTGHSSFLNHPLSAMGMWLGRPDGNALRKLLYNFDGVKNDVYGKSLKMGSAKEELASGALAEELGNEYIAYLSDAMTGMGGDGEMSKLVRTLGYTRVIFGHEGGDWWTGFANQIRILHNSEFVRKVITTKPGKELDTVNYFLKGEGRKTLDKFVAYDKDGGRQWLLTEDGLKNFLFTGTKDNLGQELVSVAARVDEMSGRGGSSALIKKLILDGKVTMGNTSIEIPTSKKIAEAALNVKKTRSMQNRIARIDLHRDFTKLIKNNFENTGNWDNVYMTVPKTEVLGMSKTGMQRIDKYIVEPFFDIAVRFEKMSTMGPEWRQSYWDAIHDISSALDSKALSALRASAPKTLSPLRNPITGANLGRQHKAWRAIEVAEGKGPLTLDEAHQYAAKVANRNVRELFYDASKRNLLWHQLRLLAPFGQAWEDTIKKWGKLALDEPINIYKAVKTTNWLTSKESSALYELTDAKDFYDPNQGFFYSDPQTQERRFFVPFASSAINLLSTIIPGAQGARTSGPFSFSATPQSFNFALGAGTFIPGAGFGIQWTIGILDAMDKNPMKLLPAQMEEELYKMVFPYGTPDVRNAGLFDGPLFTSNWIRILNGITGAESSYASAFAPTMGYLASSGEYDLLDPNDQSRLLKDGKNMARWFTMWRGMLGAFTPIPFALTPEALAKNNNGDTVLQAALISDFKNMEVSSGGDKAKAYSDFLDTYGPEQVFAIIRSTTGYEPTNLPTYNLIKQDPSVVDKYSDVYGYLYPNGELSKVLYKYQKERGGMNKLTASQVMEKAVNILYAASSDRVRTRAMAEGWSSSQLDDAISNLNASYTASGRVVPKYDTQWRERAIAQLNLAAEDPRIADSSALIAAKTYMIQRDKALAALKSAGFKTLKSQTSEPQRAWLADEALKLIKKYPEFQKIFYGIFKKELEG